MPLPNFLIIGAEKSGTSSLHYYLKQHPEIYMPVNKEPNFFAFEGEELDRRSRYYRVSVTDIESYRTLFEGSTSASAIGEASPVYLSNARAAARIQHYVPGAKLIAILRNPIDRAYSDLLQTVREGDEPCIRLELLKANRYVQKGFYYLHLKRYFDIFDRKQIRIYLYEDLENDPVRLSKDIFQFLGVNREFVPDTSIRHNSGGIPKSKILQHCLRKLTLMKSVLIAVFPEESLQNIYNSIRSRNLVRPPHLPSEMRRHCIEIYREDIVKLATLIQRDLSGWLVV